MTATIETVREMARKFWGTTRDWAFESVIAAARSRVAGDGCDPLWIMVLGPPSSGKTERLNIIGKAMMEGDRWFLDRPSPAAWVTGVADDEGVYHDLVADLSGRLVLIRDMSPILSMDGGSRDQVIGDMRLIYDGEYSRTFAKRGHVAYTTRFNLVGACTPAWESYYSVLGVLGQRFLTVRVMGDVQRQPKLQREAQRVSLSREVKDYLMNADEPKQGDTWAGELWVWAEWLARMRGDVPRDHNKTVVAEPVVEYPYRVHRQLTTLALYGGIDLAVHIARDSVPRIRLRTFDCVMHGARTIDAIAGQTKIARTPTERAVEDLVMLGVVSEKSDVRPHEYTVNADWLVK